jgi:hypothetical protein
MMYPTIRKITAIVVFACFVNVSLAQDPDPGPKKKVTDTEKKESKPFRILTNGKRITVQSIKDISYLIAWTASGNRFLEQTNIEASSFNFPVPSNEKIIFVMVQLQNGKRYTEKIGIQ